MNVAASAKPATKTSRLIQKGIVIREPKPQWQQHEKQAEKESSDEEEDSNYKCKRKKKEKKSPAEPSRDSTPSLLRRAKRETLENNLREEAWLQKQRNLATSIGASEQRSSLIAPKVDQHYVVIEDVNPPYKMRMVIIPCGEQEELIEHPAAQPSSLPLVPFSKERTTIEKAKPAPEKIEPDRIIALL